MRILWAMLLLIPLACSRMESVRVAPDGKGFVLYPSGQRFVPWGGNYSPAWKLLEDSWESDWATVERDFAEMKRMGVNVVRVHLQFGKFMAGPDTPNERSLRQFGRLIELAERTGLYLDVTGLACYRPADVPAWYDALSEQERWAVQGRFWQAVAARGAGSPAIFCYDLMNEPVSPGGQRKPGQWYSGKLFGGFDFLQWIALDQAGRPRDQIAKQWAASLRAAIRKQDRHHLITVGLLPTVNGVHFFGFVPETIAPELDFLCVHVYPERGKVEEALKVLKQFVVPGKPLVVEETYPLSCSAEELRQFLLASRGVACGWLGHFGGSSLRELEALRQSGKITIAQAIEMDWIKLFEDLRPAMTGVAADNP